MINGFALLAVTVFVTATNLWAANRKLRRRLKDADRAIMATCRLCSKCDGSGRLYPDPTDRGHSTGCPRCRLTRRYVNKHYGWERRTS